MKEQVIIDNDEYLQLLKDGCILAALNITGVYEWEGYGKAMDLLEQWDES